MTALRCSSPMNGVTDRRPLRGDRHLREARHTHAGPTFTGACTMTCPESKERVAENKALIGLRWTDVSQLGLFR